MEHTPGPWTWKEGDGDLVGSIVGGNGAAVCDFGYGEQYSEIAGTPPEPANRALMLAAPDLLEACKALRDGSFGNPTFPKETTRIEAMADAAIAKAEQ